VPDEESPLVLVAAAESGVRELIAEMLTATGFRVVSAADGPRADALLAEPGREFAAAVLDWRLAGLTGPEVLARCRSRGCRIPAVLLSGNPDPGAIARLAVDPDARFLAKPFRVRELVAAVSDLVRPG
jgi:CheY-like chemotaxis protein